MEQPTGPLATTLARLRQVEPWFSGQVGRPTGAGWFRLDTLTADERLSDWIDDLAGRNAGHRDVAGSYLGGWLAGAAITVPTAALVLERRLPDPDAPLWVHRHEDGWFDQVAFEHVGVLVAGDDAGGAHPDATVVDAELAVVHGRALAARLGPVLDAVRALTPFGRRGLWGSAADQVASVALWAARAGGVDLDATWRTAVRVNDALAGSTPWIRSRPRAFTVQAGGRPTLFTVKGTCCLFYKTQPQPPDPCGEGYCTTCPFRDDGSRHDRLVAHLADES